MLENWKVAVKRIAVNIHTLDETLFYREVKNLMKIISHPNVVRFLGFCSDTHVEPIENAAAVAFAQKRERLLCFEYINNGSLDKHITGTKMSHSMQFFPLLRYIFPRISTFHIYHGPKNIIKC